MKKIQIFDRVTQCKMEIAFKDNPEDWIEEGMQSERWGSPEEFYYEITDLALETEPKDILVSETPPENPKDCDCWIHKSMGVMYTWKAASSKWLSTDRAIFTPKENLHSEWEG